MENNDTRGLLEELRRLSEGLFYRSETDAPLEPVSFPAQQNELTLEEAVALSGQPEGTKAEVVDLDWFLRHMVREPEDALEEEKKQAQGFRELKAFLESQLSGIRVYRIGDRRITALVLGNAPGAGFAGLKTFLVET
ncbi:nuclease A inhibitor family protein [Rufibacter latericius]|uniref:Sugar-non-specific nuclease inhibitor NuiA-like protein n=1 Tax=Rufibacter latericius TaxID=2487040 RepID=A0A3M9MF18_9BACT|nr:nuclease A inhibitor family protein [Rufibacter latericius]RNI24160.1 sugar-non-specific nuclease inhibitor NuiA-like protein [Rufibacter latericius]